MQRLGAHLRVDPGSTSGPATPAGTWEVAVWSGRATAVELVIADRSDPARPVVQTPMRREGDVWVAHVPAADVVGADLYGFRVDGPWAPLRGDRFDVSKVLLDPYARRVWFPPTLDRDAARVHGRDTAATSPWGVLCAHEPPVPTVARPSLDDVVVAEVHVGAFTGSPTSGVAPSRRGTFAGMIERLDHLAALGVSVVELLPVHATDPTEGSVWGYMPLAYLAVDERYAADGDPEAELVRLADACHERGMELWVDVVYNHTTEEDQLGPTYGPRGLDNRAYYVVDDVGAYADDAGCGNVLAAAHPAVADLVIASLERLADLGVDGFRFDLASILGRDDPTLLHRISSLADRRHLRLVAEPWDVVRHQVGPSFPGVGWWQWNDRFRDVVRSFVKGDPGLIDAMEQVVRGSPELFPDSPRRSVDFVTAHDGFTLRDLVSYDRKHNERNGHANTDGSDDNRSWNCGWEGDDGVPDDVVELRRRQVRNLLVVLLCSAGTPMLLAGDELGRTQYGNNNAYRADDETVWLDWSALDTSADLVRFVAGLVAFRRRNASLTRATHWGDDVTFLQAGSGHDLGWWLRGASCDDDDVMVFVNAHWRECVASLPPGRWRRVVDTSLPFPDDMAHEPVSIDGGEYRLGPRSAVVLVSART